MQVTDLEAKIQKLEKEIRTTRRIGAILAVTLVAIVALGGDPKKGEEGALDARVLRITTENGDNALRVFHDKEAGPGLLMYDPFARDSVRLDGGNSTHPKRLVFYHGGDRRFALESANETGDTSLRMLDNANRTRLLLQVVGGAPSISMFDENGKVTWSAK